MNMLFRSSCIFLGLQCTTGWASFEVTCKISQESEFKVEGGGSQSSGARNIKEAPDASPLSPSKAFQLHPSPLPHDPTIGLAPFPSVLHCLILSSVRRSILPSPSIPLTPHPSPSESCASWSHHKSCPLLPTPSRSPFPSLSGVHQALYIVPWAGVPDVSG